MKHTVKRSTATLAAGALAFGAMTLTTFAPTAQAAVNECVAATGTVAVFGFNDFHGRILTAAPMFSVVEQARTDMGAENVALISSGDNIGASIFESMVADDAPALDILDAVGVDASTVGNHEFDKGWSDLSGRVAGASDFPYVGANVYTKGTTTVPAPLQEYALIEKGGVTIALVGAVTKDVPSLVDGTQISNLEFGDPIAAVNRVTAQLLDSDPANGEADIVLASFHEGAGVGGTGAASTEWATALNEVDDRVATIFNAHTHMQYNFATADGTPVVQAGSYAEKIARVDLSVDATNKALCGTPTAGILSPMTPPLTTPALTTVNEIVAAAKARADQVGAEVIGEATAAISTPGDGGSATRNHESPMTNLVAQMFAEVLGAGDPEFIGIQNPGGTRDSFNAGDITYREAALTLPFANSLFTTQVTGAQFIKVLNQQWQRDKDNNIPSRAFLQLGLSDNVTYTYDESLPEGSRITGVWINGAPIDEAKLYTVGSGSFLIGGGDNFWELGKGVNTADTGRSDLGAWTEWVPAQGTLSPDYTKRGVSTQATDVTIVDGVADATLVKGGTGVEFTLGQPLSGGVAPQTLDMFLNVGDKVSPKLANTTITAYITDAGGTEVEVGSGTVTDGVGTITVAIPADANIAAGAQRVTFVVEASGTNVHVTVDVATGIQLYSAGSKLVGSATNIWGNTTLAGMAGKTVTAEVLVDGVWTAFGTATVAANGSFVIPVSGAATQVGTHQIRVTIDGLTSNTVEFERMARSTSKAATWALTGNTANVWGRTGGPATVSTQVLVAGQWSTSQIREADGFYAIPLTYGMNQPGTYVWRVVVNHANGEREILPAFTQTRVAAPTAKSAGTAPVRRLANVWGTAGPGGFTKVWTEVRMSNGSWSKSQQTVTAFNGGYVLPLTYGSTVPGTYSWRVAAEYPGIGVIRSATFTFVRTA